VTAPPDTVPTPVCEVVATSEDSIAITTSSSEDVKEPQNHCMTPAANQVSPDNTMVDASAAAVLENEICINETAQSSTQVQKGNNGDIEVTDERRDETEDNAAKPGEVIATIAPQIETSSISETILSRRKRRKEPVEVVKCTESVEEDGRAPGTTTIGEDGARYKIRRLSRSVSAASAGPESSPDETDDTSAAFEIRDNIFQPGEEGCVAFVKLKRTAIKYCRRVVVGKFDEVKQVS
jgi:hypothetical protein